MHDRDAITPPSPAPARWGRDQIRVSVRPTPGGFLAEVAGDCFAAVLTSFVTGLVRPCGGSYAHAQGWFLPVAAADRLESWLAEHIEEDAVCWEEAP